MYADNVCRRRWNLSREVGESLVLGRSIGCRCPAHFTLGWCTPRCRRSRVPLLPPNCASQSSPFIPMWRHCAIGTLTASDNSLLISCGNLCAGNRLCMFCMVDVLAPTFHLRLRLDPGNNLGSCCGRSTPRLMDSMTTSKCEPFSPLGVYSVIVPTTTFWFLTDLVSGYTVGWVAGRMY